MDSQPMSARSCGCALAAGVGLAPVGFVLGTLAVVGDANVWIQIGLYSLPITISVVVLAVLARRRVPLRFWMGLGIGAIAFALLHTYRMSH